MWKNQQGDENMSGVNNTNNPLELLIGLAVNSDTSKKNIKTAISEIQKDLDKELDVTLSIKSTNKDNNAFTETEKQIDKVIKKTSDLNKTIEKVGKSSGTSDAMKPLMDSVDATLKSFEDLEREVAGMNGKIRTTFEADDLTKYKNVVTQIQDEFGKLQTVKYQALYNDENVLQGFQAVQTTIDNSNFDKFQEKLHKARLELDEVGKQGKMSSEQIRMLSDELEMSGTTKGIQDTLDKMRLLNKEAAREIKHSTIDQINQDADGLIRKINELGQTTGIDITTKEFDTLIGKATELSERKIFNDKDLKDAQTYFNSLNKELNEIVSKSNKFSDINTKLNRLVADLGRSGAIDSSKVNDYANDIMQIGTSSSDVSTKVVQLTQLLNRMNDEIDSTKHNNSMAQAMKSAHNEIDDLLIQLRKVENQWKRTVNKDDVARVRAELTGLTVPNFTKQSEVNDFSNRLKDIKRDIKGIGAEATQAARSSMGVIESFKVAMERFPIWMAASTVFYGAVRGVKDLTDKVIELDTQLTNIRRVMDMPSYKFNEMLEKSISNVTELSGLLNDYMKLVEEFGRMGFDDVESLDLADTAAMLQNISELTPDQSVSSLVAAMINFNIVAEDSIRVADKLNEIDNNYSTTTLTLAQAMNKASSTAKTFGVTLDELLGHTTAISAATRESGGLISLPFMI